MKYVFFIILIAISFAVGFYTGGLSDTQDARIVYDTIPGDSVFVETVKKEFYPIVEDTTIYETIYKTDTFYKDVDTAKILRDYYTYRIYKDTLKNDSSATVVIRDSISRNRKLKSSLFFKNNRPIAYETTIINRGLFLGGSVSPIYIGIDAGYISGSSSFGAGINFVNINNNLKLVPEISYKHQIKIKRWKTKKLWMR